MSLFVDSHQHFWDPARADYPWMTDQVAAIRRPFMPDDLRPLLADAGVACTVVVQARSELEETRELLGLAARTDFIAGVVGWADLTQPALADTLAELTAGEGGEKLVGIRHQVHDEPDEAWLLREDVKRGLQTVRDADLAYDLLVRTRELPAARAVARELDDLRFVIDHSAKPRIAAGPCDEEWAERMAPFAGLENVSCKVSGLVTEADWRGWRRDDLAPYIERVAGWFGEDRLLFGSDWPVCLLAASYKEVWETARSLLPNEKAFGANAISLYRLEVGSRSTTA